MLKLESCFSSIDMYGNKMSGRGHIPKTRYRYSYSEETSHDRVERRLCQIYNNGDYGTDAQMGGGNTMVCLTNTRTYIKTGRTTTEKHYYITSLPLDSELIMDTIRKHWSIENNLHWQLDVSFNEDSQKKKRNTAQNFR